MNKKKAPYIPAQGKLGPNMESPAPVSTKAIKIKPGAIPIRGGLPSLTTFIANCNNCKADTLFSLTVDKGKTYIFCSRCSNYTPVVK